MTDKWVGAFALVIFVASAVYFANSALTSQSLAVRPSALLALAVKASDSSNKLCPQPSATEAYRKDKPPFPAKYEWTFLGRTWSTSPAYISNLYGKPCSQMDNENKIFVISHCEGPGQCHADKYEDQDGNMHDIQGSSAVPTTQTPSEPESFKYLREKVPSGASQIDCSGWFSICSQAAIEPPPATPPIPSAPTIQGNEIVNAFKPIEPGSTVTNAATPPANTGSIGGGSSGGPGPAAVAPPPPSFNPNGLTSQPSASLVPNNSYVSPQPSQGYSPQATYQPQTTFDGTNFSQPQYQPQYQSGGTQSPPPSNGFVSGLASLIGGLFSVPTNAVVTYIQSFVGPSQPTRTISQPQNPTQALVVLPYPVPPAPTSDIYAQIRSIANQENGTPTPSSASVVGTAGGDNTSAPISTPSAADGKPEGASSASGKVDEQVSAKPKTRAEVEAAFMKDARPTTTESTSTPSLAWHEPDVVEIGVAVDITDPASYESILAYIKGDWAHVLRTTLQKKVALAQAESERESIVAHIGALQEARAAGICDEMCDSALSALQRDLPQWQSRVDVLETAVKNDAAPQAYPPPTVGQIRRVADSLAEPSYQASEVISPRSASSPPAVVSVASQETTVDPAASQTRGEATVLRVVKSVWEFLKSIFLPREQISASATSTAPQQYCSLFLSLFGKCK